MNSEEVALIRLLEKNLTKGGRKNWFTRRITNKEKEELVLKKFEVHVGGGYSPLEISGKNLVNAIEKNFDRIAKAHQIGNVAGYKLTEVVAEYKKGILGGKGGVVLYVTAKGLGLAHKPASPNAQTTEIWIFATPEDMPEKHVFELS